MKSNYNIPQRLGINQIYKQNGRFYSTTVLATCYDGKSITVADMLKFIEKAISFIRANFDVNQEKYSETIKLLQISQKIFNNQKPTKIRKDKLNLVIDVIHEITDMNATNDFQKQENERIAWTLKWIIDNSNQ